MPTGPIHRPVEDVCILDFKEGLLEIDPLLNVVVHLVNERVDEGQHVALGRRDTHGGQTTRSGPIVELLFEPLHLMLWEGKGKGMMR